MNCSRKEPMVEMFILENLQLVKLVEESIEEIKQEGIFGQSCDEVFRIMHVIRGNSSMMLYDNISMIAHHIECVFAYLKDVKPDSISFTKIMDFVSESLDFIKSEVTKIDMGKNPDGDPKDIIKNIEDFLINMNSNSNPNGWNPKPRQDKSLRPKFYIKSLQNSDDISTRAHLVKELNLNGISSQSIDLPIMNEGIKRDEADSKSIDGDGNGLNKNCVSISVSKFKIIMDLINELAKNETDAACSEESDKLTVSFIYRFAQRRRKIINDLQNIVLSINIGL